jgi:DNA/RNA-binding domain of Phe-tRNA-synthetase-like protein
MIIRVDPHPLLDLAATSVDHPAPLGAGPSPAWLVDLLRADAVTPLATGPEVWAAGRELLRQGGFKPKGRNKPAAEYLQRAAAEGALRSINPAVDAANAVSLHSGLALSVVDRDSLREPLRVGTADPGAGYVFNPAGQVIELQGLLCLFDATGPCANAVKDAQRTKTGPATHRTLGLIWGTTALPGRAAAALAWYRELLEQLGCAVAPVDLARSG